MKFKKIIPITALALSAIFLSACTQNNNKVVFSDYWAKDATLTVDSISETLEYDVTTDKAELQAESYFFSYSNGKYTTSLSTEVSEEGKTVYVLESTLTIDVTYRYGVQAEKTFNDRVYSRVKFHKAANALQPISSHKEVKSTTPANNEAVSLESCYLQYDYTMDVTYSGTDVKSVMVENKEGSTLSENTYSIDNEKYTYLDNEQLLFALRGVKPTANGSNTFLVYNPFLNAAQKVKATYSAATGADTNFAIDGVTGKQTVQYIPIKIELDEKNPGQAQTAWIAETTDSTNNKYRNVMLRLETPLSYGYGTLIYTLKNANFSK